MIVRCANCHTEFSLEDQQIGPEGATVRCSVCGYVFPVEPPPGVGDLPWQVRTVEDLLFTAPDLATLRAWIAEGRLHPDDQVSRTGRHWLRLGDMPEFSTVFSGFSDLPAVFERLDEPPLAGGSAIDELGPPPSFAGAMPIVQGVDTDILVVDHTAHESSGPVAQRSVVGRDSSRPHPQAEPMSSMPAEDSSASLPAPPPPPSRSTPPPPPPPPDMTANEASGPMPFPLTELGMGDEPSPELRPSDDEIADESAVRMRPRPRPYTPTARVDALPEVPLLDDDDFDDSDDPIDELPAGVPTRKRRATVLYGGSGPASMLDVVTNQVDEEAALVDSTEVAVSAAAQERVPVRPREPSGARNAAVPPPAPAAPSAPVAAAAAPVAAAPAAVDFDDEPERKRKGSPWPLIAGLGLVAGVAVIFGVPSIRAKVMDTAGRLVGGEPFDMKSLGELDQAKAAMHSLDPAAVGEAEAALQARIDGGQVPPEGVAAMKLAQVELLATRAIEHKIGGMVGAAADQAGPTDVDRAGQILAGVVGEDVSDGAHMRLVRARLRLAQGRPGTEILPLLPDGDGADLRALVVAAPLWRDPKAAVPSGAIEALESAPSGEALGRLALSLAYLRAGDSTKANTVAQSVLDDVPQQPTATALMARGGGAVAGDPSGDVGAGSDGEPAAGSGDDGASEDGSSGSDDSAGKDTEAEPGNETDGAAKAPAKPKTMSVDAMIGRGCDQVESGKNVAEGLALLRKAKLRRPADLDLQLCIGVAHKKQGRTGQALAAFEGILSRSPSFTPAVRNAAKAAADLGQTQKAVKYYRKLLSLRPGDAKALAYVKANAK